MARADINMPDYDGFPIHVQVPGAKFVVAVYKHLGSVPGILVSCLLLCFMPIKHPGPSFDIPQDIAGLRLFLFERAEGEKQCMLGS